VKQDGRIQTPLALVAIALATFLSACGSDDSSGIDQFRDKTESSILDFGEEGNESEGEQANETVSEFLAARSAGDWEAACEQIDSAMVDKLEKLASSSTSLPDKSCASLLDAFAQISAAELSEESTGDGSLRHAGSRGFLVYSCADDAVCAMPLKKDGGEWKVGAISAKLLS
jgi:hypothetical protein